MAAKSFLVLCASALLVKSISSQILNPGNCNCNTPFRGNSFGCNSNIIGAQASGGGLTVTSSSPFAPTGLQVISENNIDGTLSAIGQLPILSAVAVESNLPTSGTAGTSYSCGNGNVGITSELPTNNAAANPAGPVYNGPAGPVYNGPAGPGYNGPAGPGYNCPGPIYNGPIDGQIGIGNGCNGIYF